MKGVKTAEQRRGGEEEGSNNVYIPITDRVPIRQELRFMDHWE